MTQARVPPSWRSRAADWLVDAKSRIAGWAADLQGTALPLFRDCQSVVMRIWQARRPGGPSLLTLSPYELKLVFLLIPVVLTSTYLLALAANRYESVSIVSVRQVGQDSLASSGIAAMLGGNPSAREDVLYLQKFIHSLDLAKRLDASLELRRHYGSTYRDLIGRLWEFSSQEAFLDHYRRHVSVIFDDLAGTLRVGVQGYDAEFAQALASAILSESEAFVNEYSRKIARDQLSFAEQELREAAARLQQAKESLMLFQRENQMLDPLAQARAASTVYAELAAQLSRLEAELKTKQAYLGAGSFEIRGLEDQIRAVERQIQAEGARTTAQGKDAQLNAQAARFQDLLLQVEFSQEAYKLALGALESARIDSTRKAKSLVVIEPPGLPDSAAYPERLYWIATVLLIGLLLYAIARAVIATLLEHQDPHESS